jgi:hypothetical protein
MKKFHAGSSRLVAAAAAGAIVMFFSAGAIAQVQPPNNPPAGAYQPIPNFSGPGAGLLFRRAINDRFSGAATIAPAVVRLPLASLPPVVDGMVFFCTDCKRVNPCATGGAGAWAMGARAAWRCAEGPLEADLDVAGRKLTNVAAAGASGEALSYAQSGAVLAGLGASGQKLTGVGAGAAAGDALAFAQAGAKLGDVTDTGAANGSNTISNFSINGVRNVRNYGATADATTTAVTTATSNPNVTVTSATSFAVGQAITIHRAGAAPTITAPTGLTLTRQSYTLNPDPTPAFNDNSCNTTGWATGGAGSVTFGNANCTTTRRYAIIAIDSQGGWTAPTATTDITNSAATLSASNRVKVSWNAVTNATAYAIYNCSGAACTPTLKAVVPAPTFTEYIHATDDAWSAFAVELDFSGVLQGGAKNRDLLTTITAIAGTTVTLAAAPSQTGTFTLRHDDGPAINAALTNAPSLCTNGGEVQIPVGVYPIATSINLAECAGVKLRGSSYPRFTSVTASVVLSWTGGLGGTVVNMNRANSVVVENLAVQGNSDTPGIAFDLDRSAGGGLTPSHNTLRRLFIGRSGVGVAIARDPVYSNNELHTFDDITIGGEDNTDKGGYIGFYISGFFQTNNEKFYGVSVTDCTYLFKLNQVGHLELFSPNYSTGVYANAGGGGEVTIIGASSENNQMFWAESSPQMTTIINSKIYLKTSLNGYCADFSGAVVMIGGELSGDTFPCKLGLSPGGHGSFFSGVRFSDAAPLIDRLITSDTDRINFVAFGNVVKGLQDRPIVPQATFQVLDSAINARQLRFNQGFQNSIATTVLPTPGAPGVSVEGTTGATSYTYFVVCEDANGGRSLASPGTTITNGNATLDTTNRNYVTVGTNCEKGYAKAYILKTDTSTLLGTTTPNRFSIVYDVGQATSAFTAPTRNTTADITVGGGLGVGGGALLKKRLASTFSLNLAAPGVVPGCVDSAAQAVTGVALGDVCSASMSVNMQGNQQLGCFVNAADQVTYRVCQLSGAAADPDGGGATYRAVVEQY